MGNKLDTDTPIYIKVSTKDNTAIIVNSGD